MFDQNHNHATIITSSNIGNNTTTTNYNSSSSNNSNNNIIINDSNSNNIRRSGSKNVKNKFRNFSKKIYFRSNRYEIMLMK